MVARAPSTSPRGLRPDLFPSPQVASWTKEKGVQVWVTSPELWGHSLPVCVRLPSCWMAFSLGFPFLLPGTEPRAAEVSQCLSENAWRCPGVARQAQPWRPLSPCGSETMTPSSSLWMAAASGRQGSRPHACTLRATSGLSSQPSLQHPI